LTLAAIGFGGNLGDPERAFAAALDALRARRDVRVVGTSSLWRSDPWGGVEQPAYLNGVALVRTTLDARVLLDRLLEEEARAGRVRGERWGPRCLDLDLLFHGDAVLAEPGLRVPHPRLAERSFVLEPLAEVAAGWRHPRTGRDVAGMLDALRGSPSWTGCTRIAGSALGRDGTRETACRT
jgi:2-amino-4-hydroxy-6-hydroxymethyldihydropteridine diphosphokinase